MQCSQSSGISVDVRIRFVRLPDLDADRIFRDTMVISDPEGHNLDDFTSLIDKKIAFMEYPPCDYTVLFKESNGDTVVVDHSYYTQLLMNWFNLSATHSETPKLFFSVDVEIHKTQTKRFLQDDSVSPLTAENLAKLAATSNGAREPVAPVQEKPLETQISISSLTCPPSVSNFSLRGVVIDIRMKSSKSGVQVVEFDLSDPAVPTNQITAVSFDATVRKAIKDQLKADKRQLVELHRVYVRRKNEVDVHYQTNNHLLLLRLDKYSRIEIVQILTVPLKLVPDEVITVRQNLIPNGFIDVGTLSGLQKLNSRSSSNSLVSSQVKLVSSGSAAQIKAHTEPPKQPVPHDHDIVKRNVDSREDLVYGHAAKEEARKMRIRRKLEASNQCILCGLNTDDEEQTLSITRRLLAANWRSKIQIPTIEAIRGALSDNRPKRIKRLYTAATFVNMTTKTVHHVHCRCAHICTRYQRGSSIEDIVYYEMESSVCSLCGFAGAIVSCYHPDCTEQYHAICALFCGGYVNFGKKDPYMPCPACPKHTQVVLGSSSDAPVLHDDPSCWDDQIGFDSRVVESTDLRDPDENGGN